MLAKKVKVMLKEKRAKNKKRKIKIEKLSNCKIQ